MDNSSLIENNFPRIHTSLHGYSNHTHLNNSPGSSPVNQAPPPTNGLSCHGNLTLEGNTNDRQSHNNLDRNPKAATLAKCQQLRSGHKSG